MSQFYETYDVKPPLHTYKHAVPRSMYLWKNPQGQYVNIRDIYFLDAPFPVVSIRLRLDMVDAIALHIDNLILNGDPNAKVDPNLGILK